MKTHIITIIITAICILISSQGCTTSRMGSKEISVRLSNEGRIYVGDRYTGLKKLVKQLKANGARKEDRIVINIPNHTSPNALKGIGRELASNGYSHILFKQEHKPSVKKGRSPLMKHRCK